MSSTAATESVLITAKIDAHEIINVAVFEITGVYLHTETDEDIIVVLEGVLDELTVKVDPSIYHKYVTLNSKSKSLLYVQIHKALYGLLRSALLFYQKLVRDLEVFGFKINPYDPCVANNIVNGS